MTWSTSGSGPSETSNSWNWPGLISAPAVAVQVIFVMASVISSPSSVLMGVASLVFSVTPFHPASGLSETDAIGVSVGRLTSSLVVEAVSLSLGTRKATLV